MSNEYVCGFLFNRDLSEVVLIRKLRPEWQKGRLNGVGGKVEPHETPLDAMRREFQEEAGAIIREWNRFCILSDDGDRCIHFYWAKSPLPDLDDAVDSMTDEGVVVADSGRASWDRGEDGCLPNLCWLLPMAKADAEGEFSNFVHRVQLA